MWNELVTTALIGTERRQLNLESPPDDLCELAAQLAYESAERQLLALAGATALYRRAGQIAPTDDTPLLDPCDLDDLPPCSPRAGLLLQQMFAVSTHAVHLTEWMQAAAKAGQRVSDEYLPRVLMQFEGRQSMVGLLYEVLGKRGRWLAQQNPNWSYAVLPENDEEWALAAQSARLHYLRQLRATDPAHGRALVESVWQSEKAEDRALFLQTFEISLSLEDEPFLEAALDDRASSVKLHAGLLLKTLAGSAYQKRMIARAEALIKIGWQKHRLSQKLIIEITLPETCDESMKRDGIDSSSAPDANLGERARWLLNLAVALPSSYWLSGDWSERDLVEAVGGHGEWSKLLLAALARTAEREQHDALAYALLQADLDPAGEVAALRAARPETREAYALHRLSQEIDAPSPDGMTFRAFLLLCTAEHRWSAGLTQAFLKAIIEVLPKLSAVGVMGLAGQLLAHVLWMHPAHADELLALATVDNKSKPMWSSSVKRAAQTLEFRQKIHKEFAR